MPAHAVPSLLHHVRRLAAVVVPPSSDEQLLEDFVARRSGQAFAALVDRHGPMVLNVCRRILHDQHAAEDVFQATFLVLADRAEAIRNRSALAGFLHGVAYRLAVRARRRQQRDLLAVGYDSATVCDKAADPPEGLAWKEMLAILDHALGQLSERHRAPLVLCYLEGRTQDEAARQLGWSLNTLRRRLAQGRRLLEARLRGRGVTLSSALAGVLASSTATVPAHVQAATLAAAGARLAGGVTAGVSVFSSAPNGITLFFSTSGRKASALITLAALCAVCFAYCWTPGRTDESGRMKDEPEQVKRELFIHPSAFLFHPSDDDPLPAQSRVRLGTARYRHGTRIEMMAVSADGKRAVTASGNSPYNPALAGRYSPLRVFDLSDGRCLLAIPDEGGAYDDYPEAVSLSPDGTTLATRDEKFLCFRDAKTGKELRKLNYLSDSGGGRSPTEWITFTPDSKHVAVTLLGDAIQLVDVETCKVIRTFAPGAAASACVFSPDGKLMASAGYDLVDKTYHARIWDVATGKELRRFPAVQFPNGNGGERTLAFSADGTLLAGGGWGDARLRIWETATGKEPHEFPKVGEEIRSIAFAPDGKTVAAAADNVCLYDPATGKERLRIERRAQQLTFSSKSPLAPLGRGVGGEGLVLIGAVSGAIYRWDAATGRQLTPAAGQDSAVEQILVSADGKSLFTTDQEGDLYLWDAAGVKPPRRIAGGIERGVVASLDRRLLAWTAKAEHGNSRIRLYDVAADRIIDPVPRSSEGIKSIGGVAAVAGFLPDGKSLLTFQANPATFRIWDVQSGQEQRSFAAIPPKSVGMRSDAAPAAEGFDVPVNLWDVATGKAGQELSQPMNVLAVPGEVGGGTTSYMGFGPRPFCTTRRAALSPDGKTLALGCDWAAPFGNRQMKPMDGRTFSPDGRFLVDWAENPLGPSRMDHVHVWEAATGRAVASLTTSPRNGATIAAFAPDGRTLATAAADGIVRLWETATWKIRGEFRGHRDRVTAVAFAPDGRLFTGGLDTVILAWDVLPPTTGQGVERKQTLAAAWEALASPDAKAGSQAQGRFLAEPAQAIGWFAARLKPDPQPDAAHVKSLIAGLDDGDFATRARATAELKEFWPATAAALRAFAAKAPSLEARRRTEAIIREMEKALTPDKLRAMRAVEILEWIGTREARAVLVRLAQGAPESPLTRDAAAACNRLAGYR